VTTPDKLLQPGVAFGEYTVVQFLGSGAAGAVYLLRTEDNRLFAAKIPDPSAVARDPEFVARFVREGELAQRVNHPNVVRVFDIGLDPDTGYGYQIMEYLPGGTLRDRIEAEGRLSVPQALSVTAHMAYVLALAHAQGIIHRDVKPDNIMFSADGRPKLADLGIAKVRDEVSNATLTSTGELVGTPAYMAPEQMLDPHGVDYRADVYSLGLVLFEMLTGRRAYEGAGTMEVLAKSLRGVPVPDVRTIVPDIPESVALLVARMCEPNVQRRMASARDVVAACTYLIEYGTGTLPPAVWAHAPSPAGVGRRSPWLYVLQGLTVLALLAFVAAVAVRYGRSRSRIAIRLPVSAVAGETAAGASPVAAVEPPQEDIVPEDVFAEETPVVSPTEAAAVAEEVFADAAAAAEEDTARIASEADAVVSPEEEVSDEEE